MAKTKSKTFTDAERAILRKHGYDPRFYEPIHKQEHCLIIKNRYTGEVKLVDKKQIPS